MNRRESGCVVIKATISNELMPILQIRKNVKIRKPHMCNNAFDVLLKTRLHRLLCRNGLLYIKF